MATKTKQWADGSSATIQYGGQGDGEIIITSDPNNHYEARSMQIIAETTDGSGIQRVVTINQAAKQRIDLSAAVVTAATQTYSGSAKTPTPTVILNGSTVPSSGYDVAYSNNTNAGTAKITITGKGDYTGVAYGTFTINKATPTYTAPTAKSLTYTGSAQTLVNAGTASGGTMYYKYTTTNSKPTSTSGFSSSIPTRTTAGTYYVWYYVAGDSNHNDTAISSTAVSVTIAKKSRSMSWSSYPSSLYVGSTGTLSATASAGGSDGTISYSSSNSSKASVSGSTVTAVAAGTCTIYATISEGTNYLSASTSYTLTVKAIPSDAVDLGLPSGRLWCSHNVGANSEIGYGQYFSWGNIDGHTNGDGYDFGTEYSSSPGASLTSNISSTDSSHDAALANQGSPWRMPTSTDFQELKNNTDYEWTMINGVAGYKFMKKSNHSVYIFMPASGYRNSPNVSGVGSYGYYWTSIRYNGSDAYIIDFSSSSIGNGSTRIARFLGGSIRGVI